VTLIIFENKKPPGIKGSKPGGTKRLNRGLRHPLREEKAGDDKGIVHLIRVEWLA